ncbi:MAG: class I SAM-dependent RNA methyltransferase [Oscillospiraceae bacterium]|nr:class I SAM-dependent RNA methyltransferase [Oscillospiraceae bacterium]
MTLCAPCLFGLEGLVADELRRMGCENVRAETGRVLFDGDERALVRANLLLRTAERVYILVGEFHAGSFDELFEGVKALPWEKYIDRSGQFPVRGSSLDSALHSLPDCQKIIKKAAAVRLASKYGLQRLPESGELFQIRFSLLKDRASIYLDTSGVSLHKRGWRPNSNLAPLRETLAAAIVKLSRYKGRELFTDPFCGSGTIAIEAALAALNRAPGLSRGFAAEKWPCIPSALWKEERDAARAAEYRGEYRIIAGDIDPAAIDVARDNARRAGVDKYITFSVADALKTPLPPGRGILATNPPYGERLLDAAAADSLYRAMGRLWRDADDWNIYVLTSSLDFEKSFGRRAVKRRKLYNGMIQCQLYQYFAPASKNRKGGDETV